jgi:deoxyribose-phosphate aldolase
LKAQKLTEVTYEINEIKKATGKNVLKVIVETCLLSEQDKINACKVVLDGGADFIKTSTGFSTGGATVADIKLFKQHVGNKTLIKASGGVKTFQDMINMINAGANRIGTSRGVSLMAK